MASVIRWKSSQCSRLKGEREGVHKAQPDKRSETQLFLNKQQSKGKKENQRCLRTTRKSLQHLPQTTIAMHRTKQQTDQYKGRGHKSPDTVRTKTPNFAISIEEKE